MKPAFRRFAIFAVCVCALPVMAAQPARKTPPTASGRTGPAKTKAAAKTMSPFDTLRMDLKAADVRRRVQAVEELGRMRDPRAEPLFMEALSDPDVNVRAGAARGLGFLRSKSAVPALSAALEKDGSPSVRQAAAVALGFVGDPAGVPALRRALKDNDPAARYAACHSLGIMGSKEAVPDLVDSLGDPSPVYRVAAINALGEIGELSAAERLRPLMSDADISVQTAALRVLGRMKDQESLPALKTLTGKKNPAEVRVAAALAMARMGQKKAKAVLLGVLSDRKLDVRSRLSAALALGEAGDPSMAPKVKKVADSEPEGPVKNAAQQLLNRWN